MSNLPFKDAKYALKRPQIQNLAVLETPVYPVSPYESLINQQMTIIESKSKENLRISVENAKWMSDGILLISRNGGWSP